MHPRPPSPPRPTKRPSFHTPPRYLNGALRITRTPGRATHKNCVNLRDVIQKEELRAAMIYAFYIEDSELFPQLPFSFSEDRVPVR